VEVLQKAQGGEEGGVDKEKKQDGERGEGGGRGRKEGSDQR